MSLFNAEDTAMRDIDEVIAEANSLMDSVYRDLSMSPRHRRTRSVPVSSTNNYLSPIAEVQIARMNNVLESVENNLRQEPQSPEVAVQVPANASINVQGETTPQQQPVSPSPVIIDLCTNSPACDDVVFVSRIVPAVNDLGTSGFQARRRSRQRSLNSTEIGNGITFRSRSPTVVICSPDVSKSKDQINESSENNLTCPICMELYAHRQPHATKCGHIYCKDCIKQAIRITHKCPICKAKLNEKMLIRIFM